MKVGFRPFIGKALAAAIAASASFLYFTPAMAADHGDGPFASVQRSGDIGDLYAFLDPNDNKKLIVGLTFQGFIVPSEAVNFSVFDDRLQFRFDFETTGDAKPDRSLLVRFSKKATSGSTPQTATITLPNGKRFTARTTTASLTDTAPEPVVTTDSGSGIGFFAGPVDDPFFFDIPGFSGFVSSVLSNAPDVAQLQRGRDSFAGYNTLAIALSIPVESLGSLKDNIVGVSARTIDNPTKKSVDRMGNPAVNVALVPFPRKDEYNRANTRSDAGGRFANDIVGTLKALGTSDANINLLATIAVLNGDMLRVNLGTPNQGSGGGSNAEAAYPNGRRLGDDVIDTILSVVTNGALTSGDQVNANEKSFRDQFPFFAATHQPSASGTVDDLTRN